jgi:hypothetical protein
MLREMAMVTIILMLEATEAVLIHLPRVPNQVDLLEVPPESLARALTDLLEAALMVMVDTQTPTILVEAAPRDQKGTLVQASLANPQMVLARVARPPVPRGEVGTSTHQPKGIALAAAFAPVLLGLTKIG